MHAAVSARHEVNLQLLNLQPFYTLPSSLSSSEFHSNIHSCADPWCRRHRRNCQCRWRHFLISPTSECFSSLQVRCCTRRTCNKLATEGPTEPFRWRFANDALLYPLAKAFAAAHSSPPIAAPLPESPLMLLTHRLQCCRGSDRCGTSLRCTGRRRAHP